MHMRFFPDFVSAWQVRLYGANVGFAVQMWARASA